MRHDPNLPCVWGRDQYLVVASNLVRTGSSFPVRAALSSRQKYAQKSLRDQRLTVELPGADSCTAAKCRSGSRDFNVASFTSPSGAKSTADRIGGP